MSEQGQSTALEHFRSTFLRGLDQVVVVQASD
jgi:hypothetical protein